MAVLALAAGLGVLLVPATSAEAAYILLPPGYTEHPWVYETPGVAFQDLVVRPDDQLVISTIATSNPLNRADGYLHLVPPTGGLVSPANRFGSAPLDMGIMTIDGGYIYGWGGTQAPRADATSLYKVDIWTGDEVGSPYEIAPIPLAGAPCPLVPDVGALATDPLNGDILMVYSEPRCAPKVPNVSIIAELDPATGGVVQLFKTGDHPILGIAATQRGGTIFFSGTSSDGIGVIGYSRDGSLQFELLLKPGGSSPEEAIGGPATGCFASDILFTDESGVANEQESSTPDEIYLSHDPHPGSATYSAFAQLPVVPGGAWADTFDAKGNLLVNNGSSVTAIDCPSGAPAPAPGGPGQSPGGSPSPATSPPGPSAPAAGTGGGGGGASSSPAPPGLAGPGGAGGAPAVQPATVSQPATQAAAQASLSASGQGAAQGAASPVAVGLADAPDDQPSLALPASDLERSGALVRLGLGAAATTALAAAAAAMVLAESRRQPRADRSA